jgi:hypothetical protein
MTLVIMTMPAITAVNKIINLEQRGNLVEEVVYESPRQISLPVISAFQKYVLMQD